MTTDNCIVNPLSSRACEKGTKGCTVKHSTSNLCPDCGKDPCELRVSILTTEDSTENMPDVINLDPTDDDFWGKDYSIKYWPKNVKYYSQAELDRRVAEAEERQRGRCVNATRDYLSDIGFTHIIGGIRTAILNAGGKGDE